MHIKQKISVGFFWGVAGWVAKRSGGLLSVVVLARVLGPEGFGVFAVCLMILSPLKTLMRVGINYCLVQREDITEAHLSTAFFVQTVFSFAVFAAMFLLAQPIAAFFGQQEISGVLRVISAALIFEGLSSTSRSILQRNIDMKSHELAAGIGAVCCAGFAVVFAWMGYGIWSLVWAYLIQSFVSGMICFFRAGWLPKTTFSVHAFRGFLEAGWKLALIRLLIETERKAPYFLISKLVSLDAAGLYLLADRFAGIAFKETERVAYPVLFSAMSRVQKEVPKVKEIYARFVRLSSFAALPFHLIIFLFAREILGYACGEQWAGAAFALRILAVCSMLRFLGAGGMSAVMTSQNKISFFMKFAFFKVVVAVVFVGWGALYGLNGAVLGELLKGVVSIGVLAATTHRLIDLSHRQYFAELMPALKVTAVLGTWLSATIWLLPAGMKFDLVRTVSCLAIVLFYLVKREKEVVKDIMYFLRTGAHEVKNGF